jgi:hypothetical protein
MGRPGQLLQAVYSEVVFDQAASQSVQADVYSELGTSAAAVDTRTIALGAGASGISDKGCNFAALARGRRLLLRLSGTHAVAMIARQAVLGVYDR